MDDFTLSEDVALQEPPLPSFFSDGVPLRLRGSININETRTFALLELLSERLPFLTILEFIVDMHQAKILVLVVPYK